MQELFDIINNINKLKRIYKFALKRFKLLTISWVVFVILLIIDINFSDKIKDIMTNIRMLIIIGLVLTSLGLACNLIEYIRSKRRLKKERLERIAEEQKKGRQWLNSLLSLPPENAALILVNSGVPHMTTEEVQSYIIDYYQTHPEKEEWLQSFTKEIVQRIGSQDINPNGRLLALMGEHS